MYIQDEHDPSLPHSNKIDDLDLQRTQLPHVRRMTAEISAILGMDELEAKFYLNLLRTGPITASALAKEINVDRAKTYRIIDKLSSNGIVSISFSSPKLCIAAEPSEVLALTLKKKEEEIIKIRREGRRIIEQVKDISNPDNKASAPTFRVIQGIRNIALQIERILESTTDVFYLVTTAEDVSKLYYTAIPEKIKQVRKANGTVRLIVDDASPKMLPFIKRLGATEVRIDKIPAKGRIIVSKRCPVTGKLLMSDSAVRGILHENIDSECALFTNSEEMTNNIFTLCNFIWKGATSVDL